VTSRRHGDTECSQAARGFVVWNLAATPIETQILHYELEDCPEIEIIDVASRVFLVDGDEKIIRAIAAGHAGWEVAANEVAGAL
jgi:hypothetical protein